MPGANWTLKDYQAIAELTGRQLEALEYSNVSAKTSVFSEVRGLLDLPMVWMADTLIKIAANECEYNAALDSNGNRNFNEDSFIDECYKQAGMIRP